MTVSLYVKQEFKKVAYKREMAQLGGTRHASRSAAQRSAAPVETKLNA